MYPSMASPTRRLRSGAALGGRDEDLESIIEAVVARLTEAGLASAATAAAVKEEVVVVDTPSGPTMGQRRLWLDDLREQMTASANFGTREKEEVRGLLIIGEGAGPPPEHQLWYWGRVRLFLIVAHEGWSAAIGDARVADMDRLGIHLSSAVPRPAPGPRPAAAPAAEWRRRPSRPSGLRAPGRSAGAAAPRGPY